MTGTANFDAERLSDRVRNTRVRCVGSQSPPLDENLIKYFANTSLGTFDMPATVVDEHGRVILWYLPDVVAPFRVASHIA